MKPFRTLALLLSLCFFLSAQSSFVLAPVGKVQYFDNSGRVLSGGQLWSYQSGTTNLEPTYADAMGSAANSNPVILDSAGRAVVFLKFDKNYRLVLKTSAGVSLWSVEGISGSGGTIGQFVPLTGGTITGNLTVTGTVTAAHLVVTDCTGCIPAGGAGTAAGADTQVQYNNGGAFGASANLRWINGSRILNVSTAANTAGVNVQGGYVQSDQGYVANPGTATTFNAFQAPGGGMFAKSFTALKYMEVGHASTPPGTGGNPFSGGDDYHPGLLYWDDSSASLQVYDGSGWQTLGASGAGTAAGSNTQVQFNSGGNFAASSNLIWVNASKILNVTTDIGTAGVNVQNGYIQSDQGYVGNPATAVTYNAINATSGGAALRSVTATDYVQVGNGIADPALTAGDSFHAGALYYNTTSSCLMVHDGGSFNCVSGGGGGTAAGANTQLQFNNAGAFGASPNLTWSNGARILNVNTTVGTAGMNVQNGYIQSDQGYVANPAFATTYNAINATAGGVASRSVTATGYVQVGHNSGIPSVTGGDSFHAGTLYWDDSLTAMRVYNGSTWGILGGGGSGTAGGADTNVQFNSGGSFAGSSNFTWNNSFRILNVSTTAGTAGVNVQNGYMQSDQGYVANPATAVTYNAFQATGGGMTGKSFTAANYLQAGHSSTDPFATAGDSFHAGALYYSDSSACLKVHNGVSFACISGGGGGTPGGADTNVQFNQGGTTFSGSSNFTWNNSFRILNVSTTAGTAGVNVQGGYMLSDQGFVANPGTATTYLAIQAPGGGMSAKSFTALNYISTGFGASDPPFTAGDANHPGVLYYSTSSGCLKVSNGVSFGCISVGGGSGVTSIDGLTGVLTLFGTASRITVTPSGSTLTLTTPQDIATFSDVMFHSLNVNGTLAIDSSLGGHLSNLTSFGSGTSSFNGNVTLNSGASLQIGGSGVINGSRDATFSQVTTNGGSPVFQSGASGSQIAFQTTNFLLQMDGNGNISAFGQVNLTGGSSSYKMGGNVVINSAREFVGAGVNTPNNGHTAAGFNPFVGGVQYTGSSTVVHADGLTCDGVSFSSMTFKGGVLIGCS